MNIFKRHVGRRVAGVSVAAALLVLGLEAPAFAAVPTITSILPTSPSPGCDVTLTGTNYQVPANGGPVTSVTFHQGMTTANGTNITIDSDTQLEVHLPGSLNPSTATTVVLHNSSGDSAAFSFTTGAAGTCPGVPTFSPTSGTVGTVVTITGTFGTAPTAVRFNTTLATPSSSTATSVTATVPCGATTGPIHVYTATGQRTSATNFTVTSSGGAPTITSFTPTSGPVGTSVKITGTNFSGTGFTTNSVTFSNVTSTFVVNSPTQITATVPSTATTGAIKVTTGCGSATTTTNFTVSTTHSRSVTLRLKKHLVAKGVVSVADTMTACVASVPVVIQRRASGSWKKVGTTTTTSTGTYKKRIKDKPGKYRAKATKVSLNNGVDVCLAAKSPIRTNK